MKLLIYDAYAKTSEGSPRGGSTRSLIDFLGIITKKEEVNYYFLTNQLNREFYENNIKPLGINEVYMPFPKALFKYGKVYEKSIIRKLLLIINVMLFFSIRFANLIRKHKFDKVVCNELRATLTVGLGTILANKELISFVRSDYGLNSKMNKLGLNISTKIICISEGVYNLLDEKYKPKARVINESIKMFIPLNKNYDKSKTINISNIANISSYKNQLTLIKAVKSVVKEYKSVKLYIVGEDMDREYQKELENFVDENNLGEFVIFTGFQKHISKYLSISDIYIQPSLIEGLGRSIIEAFLFKLPVIGSNIPGIRSIIKNDFNGLLFDPSDHNDLANKIIELIKDKERRELFGSNGNSFVRENFNLSLNAPKIEAFFLE